MTLIIHFRLRSGQVTLFIKLYSRDVSCQPQRCARPLTPRSFEPAFPVPAQRRDMNAIGFHLEQITERYAHRHSADLKKKKKKTDNVTNNKNDTECESNDADPLNTSRSRTSYTGMPLPTHSRIGGPSFVAMTGWGLNFHLWIIII